MNVFEFDKDIRLLLSTLCDKPIEYCTLNIYEKKDEILNSIDFNLSDFYFLEICSETVMIFKQMEWLSTFVISEHIKYNPKEKKVTLKTKTGLWYELKV